MRYLSIFWKYLCFSSSSRFSFTVFPVAVRASMWRWFSNSFITLWTPPAYQKAGMGWKPVGLQFTMKGIFLWSLSKSSMVIFTPASFAMTGRCRRVFVDPDIAEWIIIAFSKASWVRICFAVMPFSMRFMICLPAFFARKRISFWWVGQEAEVGKARPKASLIICMV